MCFYTSNSKIRIATKDIVCYKNMYLLDARNPNYTICISLHERFRYKLGKRYGGKSWLSLFLKWTKGEDIRGEGYHSNIKADDTRVLVKCVIPKGSLYLIDPLNREYCSSAIKIVEVLSLV